MHPYLFLLLTLDSIIDHGWVWFWAGVGLSLVVAIRDTPEIWQEIQKHSGVKRIWPITNLALHWLAVAVTIVAAISSQIGSDRADAESKRQSNALAETKSNLNDATHELEGIKTKSSEIEDRLQPLNQPVTSISAVAVVVTRDQTRMPQAVFNGKASYLASVSFGAVELSANDFQQFMAENISEFRMELKLNPPSFREPPLGKLFARVADTGKIEPPAMTLMFLPPHHEITTGTVVVTINSLVRKEYAIPAQRTDDWRTLRTLPNLTQAINSEGSRSKVR